jgi:hypothetical protein
MGLLLRAGQLLLSAAVVGAALPSCYSAGAGTGPPTDSFYFPVGLAVAVTVTPGGNVPVLYVVNSDFDLQYNGGTLQSYDLAAIRNDAASLIDDNLTGTPPPDNFPFLPPFQWKAGCIVNPQADGTPLGEGCAPPVDSTRYVRRTRVVGAFATQLQISVSATPDGHRRLFFPVRGDASLTWADIGDPADPFNIACGQGADGRCDANHHAGNDPNQPGDTRQVTMPGEPFGMAQTQDGTAIAITHQSDTKTSLLTTGLMTGMPPFPPTMQFVLDGLPTGGIGIAAVPHDPDAVRRCEDVNDTLPCARPAFLETSRTTAEIDLLRYIDDDRSSLHRPFLQRDAAFPITSNAVGTDSRGIVIDPTPRIWCKAQGYDPAACATQFAARVFFASRTPPALGIAEVGEVATDGSGTYNADQLVFKGNVPLPPGPSSVYLAPIVDPNGNFALRVFIVCFDASQIVVYDPDQEATEKIINVGPGPFAMAFDPFVLEDVGAHKSAGGAYRFAYVASFTQSFVQMIDLDNSQPTAETFERVVYTLGQPTNPKGR